MASSVIARSWQVVNGSFRRFCGDNLTRTMSRTSSQRSVSEDAAMAPASLTWSIYSMSGLRPQVRRHS